MKQIRLLFIQIQTLPPSMQYKCKEIIDILWKASNGKSQRNRLPTKSPVELKDISKIAIGTIILCFANREI